jgi:hypothetical protein
MRRSIVAGSALASWLAATPAAGEEIAGRLACELTGSGYCGSGTCIGAGVGRGASVRLRIDAIERRVSLNGLTGGLSDTLNANGSRTIDWAWKILRPATLRLEQSEEHLVASLAGDDGHVLEFHCRPSRRSLGRRPAPQAERSRR